MQHTSTKWRHSSQQCHVLWLVQKVKRQMSKDKWSSKKYLQNTQSQVNLDSSSQPTMVSTVKEQLEYIKKILSIGALEELVPTTPVEEAAFILFK
ncbi:hypothetical protein SADUNF_Sadunf11G0037000 [Salix dunnii]|uniref:Uncharacterized protein n=1 Tax=Salix dunnii TaxID=1413687 RepID=A0A835JJI8_9ROSI|nr:hypothetical protein SADUNF_Sadunf11G0037000 [Salix dunnii]